VIKTSKDFSAAASKSPLLNVAQPFHKPWKFHGRPAGSAKARACHDRKEFHARGLRGRQALSGVFQHGLDLFAGHAGKPFEKIIHRRAVFEISNNAATGTRVPLNSHAPLTFPAMRSTAAHLLQSNMINNNFESPRRQGLTCPTLKRPTMRLNRADLPACVLSAAALRRFSRQKSRRRRFDRAQLNRITSIEGMSPIKSWSVVRGPFSARHRGFDTRR